MIKHIKHKLRETKGSSELICAILVLFVLIVFLSGSITTLGQISKVDDINQISQQMAREISLTGKVDSQVQMRLESLENTFKIDVDMSVDGNFIGGSNKLVTERDFTVIITYKSSYGVGFINWTRKDKIYVAKASGKVEEYHK